MVNEVDESVKRRKLRSLKNKREYMKWCMDVMEATLHCYDRKIWSNLVNGLGVTKHFHFIFIFSCL